MGRFNLLSFLFAVFSLCAAAHGQHAVQYRASEPKNSIEWFQRASDQMNIRLPGSAPFHLKVAFHAFPENEFLGPKEKPQIITGDGTYEETWSAPHEWRREVTLAGYHAVEVESEKGR